MPILVTDESYNALNALYGNVGDWIDGELNFSLRFSKGSGYSNKVTYNSLGSNYWLEFDSPTLITEVAAGDVVNLIYQFYTLPTPLQSQIFPVTITYIDENKIFIDQPFGITGGFPTFEHANGQKFPAENITSGVLILADKAPSAVQFEFNLIQNDGLTLSSLIDSEINGFQLEDVDLLALATPTAMTQLLNKSGGLVKDVTLEYLANAGEGWRDYKVRYKFFQWAIIQDGFSEPSYYNASDCVAPIAKINAFAEFGNPIGVQTVKTTNTQGNTGEFDENYNGNTNLYAVQSVQFADILGDPISAPDYSNEFTFEAIINAPNQVNPTSTYRMGIIWRPIDASYYQNIANFNLGNNLLLNAPENDFIADGTTDLLTYNGLADSTGARWDFKDLKFELTGVNELTISGKIIPNADMQTLFDSVADGGRKTTIWVSLGDQSFDGTVSSRRVSLKLYDEDNFNAPTKGVQIPDVVTELLYDHNSEDITIPLPQTTTEDDVLYTSTFRLIDNVNYEGIRTRIYAYNTVTEEEFTLENTFFSFVGVVNIAGRFQPNFNLPRGFNLPPTSDRNHISLKRLPFIDTPSKYGIELEYGYLSRWQYWLEQSNVNNDFFDITEPNNGRNKNWQRFSNSGDWIIRLAYYTQVNGVEDFNNFEIGIRPYEDEIAVSTAVTITIPDGSNPTDLVNNEINKIDALLTWSGGTFSNVWAEATIEDFESGNRWVISSVLAQGGIVTNPLQPLTGQTGLQVTIPVTNQALLSFNVDTNIVSADKVCLSYRIKSDNAPDYPIEENMEAEFGYSLRKIAATEIYSDDAPCVRVRRSSDNVEMDIGFAGNPLVMDETALLNFVNKGGTEPNNDGWLTTWYDQSGWNRDAVQTIAANQCRLVGAGIVDTENGRATVNQRPGGVTKKGLVMPTLVTLKTLFTVAKVEAITSRNLLVSTNGFNGWFQHGNTTGSFENFGAKDGSGTAFITSNLNQNIGYMNLRDLRIFLALNGDVETNAGIFSAEITNNAFLLGSNLYGNLVLNGNAQELIGFNVDFSGQRAFIGGNQNTFYTVY